jgi:hypothetical protein
LIVAAEDINAEDAGCPHLSKGDFLFAWHGANPAKSYAYPELAIAGATDGTAYIVQSLNAVGRRLNKAYSLAASPVRHWRRKFGGPCRL